MMCLKVLLLVTQLSLAMSTVIVITIDDEEQEDQIAAIEAKVKNQEKELNQLGNISQAQNGTINLLNKVIHEIHEQLGKYQDNFRNTSINHQDQLDQLNEKIKGILNYNVKFEMQVKENVAKVNETVQNQQKQIENLTKQNKGLQEDIQYIHNHMKAPLKSRDILGFDLVATKGWLGCPYHPCDLRMCPSAVIGQRKFQRCGGEIFQIFGNGGEYIKSGYKVRMRHINAGNKWLSCFNGSCSTKNCPGSTTQSTNFKISCNNETFTIYAQAKRYGDIIYNGDFVMLTNGTKYISIQGSREGDDVSLNFCLGNVPPYYSSFITCTKNVFQI